MSTFPVSPYVEVGGLVYFARMISKIRLHAGGNLAAGFQENLGIALDARCCSHLGVDYPALRTRVLAGGTDAEILAWGQQIGRTLTEHDLLIWNSFAQKRGWRDDASANLIKHKAAAGLGHRDDIETFFAFFEVDEGRAPR